MRWWKQLQPDDVLVATSLQRTALSLDDQLRRLLGTGALEWAHALAVDLTREYVEGLIPELAQSVDFTQRLQASAEANVQSLLLTLGSDSSGVSEAPPPQEALDFAHEAVARDVPLVAILRGYRLGVEYWLRWCAPVIARNSDPADQAGEFQLAATVGVRYIDHVSERMIAEYEREVHRRATSGAARRAALVRAVLSGDLVDVDATSDLLHYPLRARHVALSLHVQADATNQVEVLEGEARAIAAQVGATGLLTVATGLTTMDAWVALNGGADWPACPTREDVTVGVGAPQSGVSGFIQSHRESRRALEVLHLAAPGRLDRVTHYGRVRLLALMAKVIPDVQAFVTATLGSLARTDERTRELRETLLACIEANRSYVAVARSSHLHKNTVVQRVAKANELAGRDVTQDLDVHLALKLAEVLGDQVLDGS